MSEPITRRMFGVSTVMILTGCPGQANKETNATPTPKPEETPTSTPKPEETPTSTPEPEETPPGNIPDPELAEITVPNEVSVGETFNISIVAQNSGDQAGHWSTITASFPAFDDPNDTQQLSITQEDFNAWSGTMSAGKEIVDREGNRIPAEYAIAEAGSNDETYWESDTEHLLGLEITPEEPGIFVIYVRTTLTKEKNISQNFTAPSKNQADAFDQQGFPVRQIQIDING